MQPGERRRRAAHDETPRGARHPAHRQRRGGDALENEEVERKRTAALNEGSTSEEGACASTRRHGGGTKRRQPTTAAAPRPVDTRELSAGVGWSVAPHNEDADNKATGSRCDRTADRPTDAGTHDAAPRRDPASTGQRQYAACQTGDVGRAASHRQSPHRRWTGNSALTRPRVRASRRRGRSDHESAYPLTGDHREEDRRKRRGGRGRHEHTKRLSGTPRKGEAARYGEHTRRA